MQMNGTELERIGREAAELGGVSRWVRLLRVRSGIDSLGDAAYYFDYELGHGFDSKEAPKQRSKIAREIRDKLVLSGDENYPYVLLMNAN